MMIIVKDRQTDIANLVLSFRFVHDFEYYDGNDYGDYNDGAQLLMMIMMMMMMMMIMVMMMIMIAMILRGHHQCQPTASQSALIFEDQAGTGEIYLCKYTSFICNVDYDHHDLNKAYT